jgi:N utilization substance protein B
LSSPRDIRRLAFQTLFQLDVRGTDDVEGVAASLEELEGFTARERRRAMELATSAYEARKEADRDITELAPGWPPHRQPAVDRAILRLAHFELKAGMVHPKIVVNDAIDLAKEFSTEKSPAFVNGVLDKILKRVLPAWEASHGAGEPASEPEAGSEEPA